MDWMTTLSVWLTPCQCEVERWVGLLLHQDWESYFSLLIFPQKRDHLHYILRRAQYWINNYFLSLNKSSGPEEFLIFLVNFGERAEHDDLLKSVSVSLSLSLSPLCLLAYRKGNIFSGLVIWSKEKKFYSESLIGYPLILVQSRLNS